MNIDCRQDKQAAAQIWPRWTGDSIAIIASGSSAKYVDLRVVRGIFKVIAIKKTIELAPWADAVYGCDGPWWRSVRGLPQFDGLKLSWDTQACDEYGLTRILIPDVTSNSLQFDKVGSVGAGGNSGFQALNLAVQFGASRVLLIGFDLHGRNGEHWYGRNNWDRANNPTEDNFRRWRAAFEGSASVLRDRGVDVVNASISSDLKSFPKMSIDQALHRWGIRNAA